MQEALPLVLGALFLLFRKNSIPEPHNSPSSLNQVCITSTGSQRKTRHGGESTKETKVVTSSQLLRQGFDTLLSPVLVTVC